MAGGTNVLKGTASNLIGDVVLDFLNANANNKLIIENFISPCSART